MDKALFGQVQQALLVIKGEYAVKKVLSLIVITLLALSAVSARGAGQAPTGNDYLAMTRYGRVQAVTSLIDGARQGGVAIKQTPVSYCKRLDTFYAKHPDMKSRELAIILKTLIIMEYDWAQKGADKDRLARQFLGDKLYQENKARLSKI